MTEQSNTSLVRATIEERVGYSTQLLQRAGYSVEVYTRVALNALKMNPDLGGCTVKSVETAIMRCCELGLLPDGTEAVIYPFKKNARLVPMINGRLKLARQAIPGLVIRARVVYKDETFRHEEGLEPVLVHLPNPDSDQSKESLFCAYGTIRVPGSPEPEFEVMYRPTLDRYRARSSFPDGPWKSDYQEMCKKTVLGQLLKRLPRLPALQVPQQVVEPMDFEGMTWGDQESGDDDVIEGEIVEDDEPKAEPKPKPKPKPRAKPKPKPKPEPEPEPEQSEPEPESELVAAAPARPKGKSPF